MSEPSQSTSSERVQTKLIASLTVALGRFSFRLQIPPPQDDKQLGNCAGQKPNFQSRHGKFWSDPLLPKSAQKKTVCPSSPGPEQMVDEKHEPRRVAINIAEKKIKSN